MAQQLEEVSVNYGGKSKIERDSNRFTLKPQEELGKLTQAYLIKMGQARRKGLTQGQIDVNFQAEIADVSPIAASGALRVQLTIGTLSAISNQTDEVDFWPNSGAGRLISAGRTRHVENPVVSEARLFGLTRAPQIRLRK